MEPGSQLLVVGEAIRLAVAPVFLLSGIGVFLTVLTNRLARLVDRARKLEDIARQAEAADRRDLDEQLRVMAYRSRLMNRAITLITVSALLVALVVVLLFLGEFLAFNAAGPIAGLFIAAMLAFIVALVYFLREVFLAISALRIGL